MLVAHKINTRNHAIFSTIIKHSFSFWCSLSTALLRWFCQILRGTDIPRRVRIPVAEAWEEKSGWGGGPGGRAPSQQALRTSPRAEQQATLSTPSLRASLCTSPRRILATALRVRCFRQRQFTHRETEAPGMKPLAKVTWFESRGSERRSQHSAWLRSRGEEGGGAPRGYSCL